MGKRAEDLTGSLFGKWLVTGRSPGSNSKHIRWECVCSCGVSKSVFGSSLTHGRSKSCGHQPYTRDKGPKSFLWKGFGELSASYWNGLVRGAEARGLKVGVSIEDAWDLFLFQNRRCALTGEILTTHVNRERETTASLDRIDSTQDYVPGNIQWVHKHVNMAKQALTQAEFIQLCKRVAKHNEKGGN